MIRPQVQAVFSDAAFKSMAFSLWEAHLRWLQDCGFARAMEPIELKELPPPSGHEVVDLLAEFVFTRGYANAHVGLTSSDIVDNVRLMQLSSCLNLLGHATEQVVHHLHACFDQPLETVGFTHWQPAAPITWSHRCHAWTDPLKWTLQTMPALFAKQFGGAVGDRASLHLLVDRQKLADTPFPWEDFDLHYPVNQFPLQSSDHLCELRAVQWIAQLAAQLHKVAQDLRFLAATQLVRLERPPHHAGSSSMPHKTNPYKWEKVCSICRSIARAPDEVWDVMAHNSLERTLDTSWQLKSVLRRTCGSLALALDEMVQVRASINPDVNRRIMASVRNLLMTDRDLTRRVLAGESRWSAYQQMLQQVNQNSESKS